MRFHTNLVSDKKSNYFQVDLFNITPAIKRKRNQHHEDE